MKLAILLIAHKFSIVNNYGSYAARAQAARRQQRCLPVRRCFPALHSQCPFCLRAVPTVEQVLSTYGDRIRLVYRHYPLQNHPNARPAAEASACAGEQGKFWPYHDRLFADSSKLGGDDLKASAVQLGLEVCVRRRLDRTPHRPR